MAFATQIFTTNYLPKLMINKRSRITFSPKPTLSCKLSTAQGGSIYLKDLEKISTLGGGGQGIVYKVCHRPTSTIYALKEMDIDSTSHEIKILCSTDSPFIVKCYGVFEPKLGKKAILMDYMDSGTLESNGYLSESSVSDIAYQVVRGLYHLHSKSIVHLDIKPSNILIDKDMKVKISDFGVSRIIPALPQPIDYSFINIGTWAYMSPERFNSETFHSDYIYAADVWSLGRTLMAVCYEEFSSEFVNFLKCCLEEDVSKRWTVSQLLSHPFVRKEK